MSSSAVCGKDRRSRTTARRKTATPNKKVVSRNLPALLAHYFTMKIRLSNV